MSTDSKQIFVYKNVEIVYADVSCMPPKKNKTRIAQHTIFLAKFRQRERERKRNKKKRQLEK